MHYKDINNAKFLHDKNEIIRNSSNSKKLWCAINEILDKSIKVENYIDYIHYNNDKISNTFHIYESVFQPHW